MHVSGVDISPGHLRVAHDLIKGGGSVCADINSLPLNAGSFDVFFAGACFLQLPDLENAETAFAELVQTLRPHGRGVVTDLPDIAPNRNPSVCGAVRWAKPNTNGFMPVWRTSISTARKWLVSPKPPSFASS